VALVALAVALGLVVAACSTTSGTAISVNGTSLSNQQFEQWLRDIQSSKAPGAATQATGANANSYNTAFTTSVLSNQVTFALIDQELARRHITLSSSDLNTATTTVEEQLSATTDPSTGQQTDGTAAAGKPILDSLGSYGQAYVRANAGQTALQQDYANKLGSTAALQALYDKNPTQFQDKACAVAIEIPAGSGQTDASGSPVPPAASDFATALSTTNQLRTQITTAVSGGSGDLPTVFASAASSVAQQEGISTDGDLGCQSRVTDGSVEAALEDAIWNGAVGEMSQPIKGASGYYLVFVSARGNLTFAQAKPELQKAAASQSLTNYKTWYDAATKKADVTVDPQWGSWDAKSGAVVAPKGATSSTTSTTKPSGLGSLNLGGGATASTTTSTP
jgi:hypothetical protein